LDTEELRRKTRVAGGKFTPGGHLLWNFFVPVKNLRVKGDFVCVASSHRRRAT
jgi:hypothetical protein